MIANTEQGRLTLEYYMLIEKRCIKEIKKLHERSLLLKDKEYSEFYNNKKLL